MYILNTASAIKKKAVNECFEKKICCWLELNQQKKYLILILTHL